MFRIPFLLVPFLFITSVTYSQIIDKPAATVRLIRLEVIPVTKLNQKVKSLEERARRPLSEKEIRSTLDSLINEVVVYQAAERDYVSVTADEIQERIDMVKQTSGQGLQLNRELTDAELQALILQNYGITVEQYKQELEKAILLQKYVVQKKKSYFDRIEQPSDGEIEDFYQENKTAFVSPDIVRIKHIFIDTRNLTNSEDREKARKRAEDIYREHQNGVDFEDLVVKYSDDLSSRYSGGDFGYLRRDDANRKQALGKSFFETPFKMKESEVSGVVRSNIGFHILKLSEYIPFQVLSIEDTVPPQNTDTVKSRIVGTLMQAEQSEVFNRASVDLLGELKEEAEIKIFEENF